MSKTLKYQLSEEIYTNSTGVNTIYDVYKFFSDKRDQRVEICFKNLRWIDANLCAILQAVLFRLSKENNLTFTADLKYLQNKFNILFRNGFINDAKEVAKKETSILLKTFNAGEANEFTNYIEYDLLSHPGMKSIDSATKEEVCDAMIELFNNYEDHAKTDYPVFTCGQFFPKQEKIIFSIVDLGVGFLPAIKEKTKTLIKPITNNLEAIKWSVEERNTTKPPPGGLGLHRLLNCTKKHSGELQIITGDTFWSSGLNEMFFPKKEIKNPFKGSTINLIFSSK